MCDSPLAEAVENASLANFRDKKIKDQNNIKKTGRCPNCRCMYYVDDEFCFKCKTSMREKALIDKMKKIMVKKDGLQSIINTLCRALDVTTATDAEARIARLVGMAKDLKQLQKDAKGYWDFIELQTRLYTRDTGEW